MLTRPDRRSFLQLAAASIPSSVLGQAVAAPGPLQPGRVAAGADREGKKRAVGLSDTTYKVLTRDTAGALFVLEQANHQKGGPPRHLHHNEDELFYALSGEYIVEVGSERVRLQPGDCVLGPRGIPHAWAFAGGAAGRLLISSHRPGRWKPS